MWWREGEGAEQRDARRRERKDAQERRMAEKAQRQEEEEMMKTAQREEVAHARAQQAAQSRGDRPCARTRHMRRYVDTARADENGGKRRKLRAPWEGVLAGSECVVVGECKVRLPPRKRTREERSEDIAGETVHLQRLEARGESGDGRRMWVATREKTGEAVRVPVSRLYRVEWVDNEEGDESDSDESADAEMEVSADAGDANMDHAGWKSARAWAEAGEQWERMGDDEEESAGEEEEVDAGRETGDESSDDEATENGAAGPASDSVEDTAEKRRRRCQRHIKTKLRWTHQAWNKAMRAMHGDG